MFVHVCVCVCVCVRACVRQVNVVEAFDQSLCNMSRRLQRLTLSSHLNVRSRNVRIHGGPKMQALTGLC